MLDGSSIELLRLKITTTRRHTTSVTYAITEQAGPNSAYRENSVPQATYHAALWETEETDTRSLVLEMPMAVREARTAWGQHRASPGAVRSGSVQGPQLVSVRNQRARE